MNCKFLILITVLSFSPAFLLAQWKKNILTSQSLSGVELDLNDVNTLRTPDSWPLQSAIGGNYSHWQSQTEQRYLGPIGRHDQRIIRDKKTGLPIRMEGMVDYPVRNLRSATAAEHGTSYLEAVKRTLQIDDPNEEFQLIDEYTDDLNQTHLLYQQMWQGLSVWGQEIRLHRRNGEIDLMHGRYLATPRNVTVDPSLSEQEATTKALDHLAEREVVKVFDEHMIFMAGGPQVRNTELVVYQPKNTLEPRLVWHTVVGAHALSRWAYFMDAHSGEVLNRYQMVCTMHPDLEPGHSHSIPMTKTGIKHTEHQHMVLDGPATANAIDLLGVSRTIGTYEIGSDFLLLDASRPMFNPQQSTLPDNPIGAILTLDARNKTTEDGQAFYVTSSNNTWSDAAAVSAHYNAGICYDYFRSTFGRNSINGNGGTIFSVVNISDDDGSGLDNAFWNGQFMFYGNGKEAFDPLAAALDVGAHEMTHGVIQNTANLEYQDEPGALNESFADVFGVLIDRDDWQLGEDVVRLNYFPSGALRDMQNPNNGGSRLGDPGWQPAHVDEQYRGPQDNGGVHINSGIPNRAFFLFASQVGLDRAEQVYYRVLTTYLTRTSQFFDMRMAVMQASADLYGNTEVNAAASAFDAVGITAESGNTEPDEPVDVPVNDGQQFVAMVGDNGFGLYLTDTDGTPIQGANPLVSEEIISPPSISDDGSVIVFVNGSSELLFIVIDCAEAQVVGNDVLSEERIWRRAAISKDAARIAVVTQETNDQILIYDFESQNQRTYELFNPTLTEGITSDEVQ
ncbi:MAG: M4 family metallopeptidase, partial [Saprospiraceae bacterium]|nr:M4 family metallopeptidase [Saprospiraceae bacterium]